MFKPVTVSSIPVRRVSQISRQLPREEGKAVSPTHLLPVHSMKCSWCLFPLEAQSTPGTYCHRKDYVNEKIEPATFRPIAKCLNRLRHQQRARNCIVMLSVRAHPRRDRGYRTADLPQIKIWRKRIL